MTPPASSSAHWSVRSSVEAAFTLGLANFTAFFTVALIFSSPGFIAQMNGIGGIPKLAADLLGHVGAYICILCGTFHALDDRTLDVQGTLWQINQPFLRRLLALGVVQSLAVIAGAILVLPALYLMTIWAVAMPVLLIEGTGIGESFGRSMELTAGRRWRVFGASMACTLIVVAGFAVVSLVSNAVPIVTERIELQSIVRWLLGAAAATFVYPLSAVLYVLLRGEKEDMPVDHIVGALH